MIARMMQLPLTISSLLIHAERFHGSTEIVSRTVSGNLHRYTYADTARRSRQLSNALTSLGMMPGDRIGTLAWNGYRHVEIYFGVSGSGAVVHTLNPRLFAEQLIWIINDADDRMICFDSSFTSLVEEIAPHCPSVRHWILLEDRTDETATQHPTWLCYETLLARASSNLAWPEIDECEGAVLCYTSGTTGNPKGALYSHRSTVLHALSSALPDQMNLSARDVVLPVVPMFHVNAWGLPYAAALVGAKLVLPGPALDGESLVSLFEAEGVTFTAGVPTVWLGVLHFLQRSGRHLTTVERMLVGGAACPPALMRTFADDFGIILQHAWGMTELSPLGTVNTPKAHHLALPSQAQFELATRQGRPPFGIDLRIVDSEGHELPFDGCSTGDLQVRGHWVISSYYGQDASPLIDSWFPTGDVANLDADGFLQITDRSKDVIKSGGEWISSISLENIAMNHPGVAEAAAIGVFHPKWDERPVLVIVTKPGVMVSRNDLLALYPDRVAKWCIPDDILFVDALPHTATGKVSKLELRRQLADYQLPDIAEKRQRRIIHAEFR